MLAKISDVTGGGLYLLVKSDPDNEGKAAAKLWQMAYRFHGPAEDLLHRPLRQR